MKDMNVDSGKRPANARRNIDEPETVSDAEDMDENEDQNMQDDDSDEPDYGSANDTLNSRYQTALKKSVPEDEDFSFARYVHKANLG
jgi:hypothetical protein